MAASPLMREPPFLIFVYGLLRPGQTGYQGLDLAGRTKTVAQGKVRGRLYHLGDYPGLILGGDGVVHGDVLAFDDPGLWAELDAYELYDPDQPAASEYVRTEVDLIDCGTRVTVYRYNRATTGRPVVVSGNWHMPR